MHGKTNGGSSKGPSTVNPNSSGTSETWTITVPKPELSICEGMCPEFPGGSAFHRSKRQQS